MDDSKINQFVERFIRDIEEFSVAVFAGAGLSKGAGFVNWKELLRDVANDIKLNVDEESDLISLAQFHVNEHGGNRAKINQALMDEFTKDATITENHKLLASLPINTYWTTNYDTLIEDALKEIGKRVDVKITPENLAVTLHKRDAVLYKMHGDISTPNKAVITKDDYERYNIDRELFTITLKGELVSKTFLFIGFSFDDPNLDYILSRIRICLGQNQRTHYCFMRKVLEKNFDTFEDFQYAEIKQQLRIKDLMRFNIQVLLLDDYNEITDVLTLIVNDINSRNVFISGSASDYSPWGEERIFNFTSTLSKELIKNNFNIVSGFGLGIGSHIVSGALEELYSRKAYINERLQVKPFPQKTIGITTQELYTRHRNELLKNTKTAVFIFGNKLNEQLQRVEATGMIEEFDIAVHKKVVPVPIGVKEFTSRVLWERVMADFDSYVPDKSLMPLYESLGDDNKTDSEIISITVQILRELCKV